MRILATAVLFSFAMVGTGAAQTPAPSGATKMSKAECSSSWTKLDAAKSGSVAQAQAKEISDFSTADTNKDGKLSQAEFMAACDKGLVRSSSGTGTGTRGLSGSDTPSSSTPGATPSPTPGISTTPGGTSK